MTEEYILIQYKCNKHVLCSGNTCECWTREDEWNPSMAVEDLRPHRNSVGRARFLTSGDWGFWLPSIRKSGFVNQVPSERKGPSMLVTKDSNSSCNEKDNKAKESNFTESRSRLVPVPPVRWGSCARKGWPAPGGAGAGPGRVPSGWPSSSLQPTLSLPPGSVLPVQGLGVWPGCASGAVSCLLLVLPEDGGRQWTEAWVTERSGAVLGSFRQVYTYYQFGAQLLTYVLITMVNCYVSTWLGTRAPGYLVSVIMGVLWGCFWVRLMIKSVDWVKKIALHGERRMGQSRGGMNKRGQERACSVRLCLTRMLFKWGPGPSLATHLDRSKHRHLSWLSGLQPADLGTPPPPYHTRQSYTRVYI